MIHPFPDHHTSTDRLARRCHVLNNGEKLSMARRNKFLMGETVRAAGELPSQSRYDRGHTRVSRMA